MFSSHLGVFMNSHPNMNFMFQRLWILNPGLLTRHLANQLRTADQTVAARILDIMNEVKGLQPFLDSLSPPLAIEMAAAE